MLNGRTRVLLIGAHSCELTATLGLDPDAYELHSIVSGAQAFALIDDWVPDVVVVEAALPDASGYDICSRLKRRRDARRTKVLIVTSSTSLLPRVLAGSARADGIVPARDAQELASSLKAEFATVA
jgi:DNA-binding response OmpR family regulator